MGGMATAGLAEWAFTLLAATHVWFYHLYRGGLAEALMLDGPLESPPA